MLKRNLKRILLVVAAVLLVAACAQGEYRELKKGMAGDDVLALKERMYWLGYFTNPKLTDSYNGTTVERVKLLQKQNGLEQTGVATVELQELIFSDDCVWMAPTPEPTPIPTPTPPPVSPQKEVDWPERDDAGFATGTEPFEVADREDGHWIWLTGDTQIEITRYKDVYQKLVWFETYITLRNGKTLETLLSDGKVPGRSFMKPDALAEQKNAVFAISDDFYSYRFANLKSDVWGIILRNGEVLCDKTRKADSKQWPPYDIIALYGDGSMKTFTSDEHTAQEYLDMGATDTWAFGPILVQDGEMHDDIFAWNNKSLEPRMAIGCIEPYRYCVLTVPGRRKDSAGASLKWMAEKMVSMGAKEALNLDGGGTAALYFDGDLVNKVEGYKKDSLRSITSMIGITR